jgi:CO dehydrogenase maturation factor
MRNAKMQILQIGDPHDADRHAALLLSAIDKKMIPLNSGDLSIKRRKAGKTDCERFCFCDKLILMILVKIFRNCKEVTTMKLLVCGKGGSGKSTISALLARACVRRGMRVLVLDADESNFGLHRLLGLERPEDFTHYFGHKKGIFADGAADVFSPGWHLEDLPRDYCAGDESLRLMAVGKIHDAGEGCACAMGALAKTLLEHLILRENEIVIVDTEAGVEHFGRGVDRFADHILMVADPSYESVCLSEKICAMGREFEKPVSILLNKADAAQQEMLRASIPDSSAIIGALNLSNAILAAGLRGEALSEMPPEIDAVLDALGVAE